MPEKTIIRNFTDLAAWKEAHTLALMIYKITKQYPRDELFGLVSQMRRCAVSIVSNIAEGFTCQTFKEKAQFYTIAGRSITELQSQLLISRDVAYIPALVCDNTFAQTTLVHKLVNGLIKYARNAALVVPRY